MKGRVIILEGCNGVGKTTLAKLLATELGCPVFRPLRTDEASHDFAARFRALDVPANTHVDDVYAADFLAKFNVDAVLDRSLPSALVYGDVQSQTHGKYKDPAWRKAIFEWWTERLRPLDPMYIWVNASFGVAKARAEAESRWFPTSQQYAKLDGLFNHYFQRIPFRKARVVTDDVTPEDVVKRFVA